MARSSSSGGKRSFSRRLAANSLLVLGGLAVLTSAQKTAAPATKAPATKAPAKPAVTPAPTTLAPTPSPTEAPTAAPTAAPSAEFQIPGTEKGARVYAGRDVKDPTLNCIQPLPPPGVKPGSCLEYKCIPDSVEIGGKMHTTVRWCLQRPRLHDVTFGLLDMNTKEYYTGTGYSSNGSKQCGETTFELEKFDVKKTNETAGYDIMWKYFAVPIWGKEGAYVQDIFPNMLAESGIDKQPPYTGLVNDCAVLPTREWNLPPTGKQDAINFSELPTCITPGQPWTTQIETHLESLKKADFRVNLQIGTGGDKYLGAEDVYVTESNIYGVPANEEGGEYWTIHKIPFTAAQTALLKEGDLVYTAAFLTEAGAKLGKTGFPIVEREFYLENRVCNKGETPAP